MFRTIFIGGINRSGGSLLARLFDGHSDVLSYPLEVGFPHDHSIYDIFESYTGIPVTVPEYHGEKDADIYSMLGVVKEKPKVILQWGKEQADAVGVRKNYLEKAYYQNVKSDFDFKLFRELLNKYVAGATTVEELFNARHKAYFEAWDGGKYLGGQRNILMHDSAGMYLTNIDKYFSEFKDSVFIVPVRDVMGYIASEKTRLARRYFGSRRFSYPKFPNMFVKMFNVYDLKAQIRAWMVALTRAVILQEKYGVGGRLVVYRHENILDNPEKTMKEMCAQIGIEYEAILTDPTIARIPWKGNSHQGKQKGINKELASYYPKVLRSEEIELIENMTGKIRKYLNEQEDTPLDLTKIPKDFLYDYDKQKKYCDDAEKWALYSALVNSPRRRVMIKVPTFLGVLAYFYSKFVQIVHIPRLLKLRFFPGIGKQNYT